MGLKSIGIAAIAAFMAFGTAFAQTPQETKPAKSPTGSPQVQAPITPATTPALTKAELDGWLDGFMPYALASGDVAGAVVVVVKDGQVLTQRGYGFADIKARRPVDPETTLFRPGSISKLFTWTAVMQQVEQGKLDLDKDINGYLDFKVPPYQGKPITLRNLMTHTAGYEEHIKRLIVGDASRLQTLRDYLTKQPPARVYPPGEVTAYSNYGATMAAYIVQRVSGEPFNDYVTRHIFAPLGMSRSTFAQPLPANLKPLMAEGYPRASIPAKPFEYVNAAPAGSLSSPGGDMAKFMIAYLQRGQLGGAQILRPETVTLMQTPQRVLVPNLNVMALGFYHDDMNGHAIVGHGGDTENFHSDLHLLVNDGVGIFVSLNSAGKAGAAHTIRTALMHGFMDRYYPQPLAHLPTAPTAKAHAAQMQGLYWNSRRVHHSFFRLLNLVSQTQVTAKPDGTLQVSDFKDYAGATKTWREVGPYLWTDTEGTGRLSAVVRDGHVQAFASNDIPPVFFWQPTPGWAAKTWNLPLFGYTIAVLALAVLLWPAQVLVRRHYGERFALAGRRAWLYRGVRFVAIVDLLGLAAYGAILMQLNNLAMLDDPVDPWLRIAQLICLIGAIGSLVTVANAVTVWRERGSSWWAKVSATAICLAALAFVWFVLSLQLVTASTGF
jgi:CubicO group peptidase (beta-lactamase class C family)